MAQTFSASTESSAQDIRSSLAVFWGSPAGIPLALVLNLAAAGACNPLAGYAVYAWHCDRKGYGTSLANLGAVSIASDGVFGEDDGERELATMTGNVASAFTATLQVPV